MAKAIARNRTDLTAQATARLRAAGLRPTRQRVELAGLLFADHDRHVTAESLHDEVSRRRREGVAGHRLQHPAPVHRRPACCAR